MLFLLKVVEKIHLSEAYEVNLTQSIILDVLLSLHAKTGGDLLEQWNLPEQYCVVAREHHSATFDHKNVILTIVRLVDMACGKLGNSLWYDQSIVLPATPEAQILGCSELLLAELEILLEDAKAFARQ
jgi:HD-like signal output (HDOD) protein